MKKAKKEDNKSAQLRALVEATAPRVNELKYGDGDTALIVKVYPVLPFSKRMEMVREIVDSAFMGEKDSVHTYVPEFLSFFKKYTAIKFFTDLELPEKLDDAWLVLNYTPIYDDVIRICGEKDIGDIFEAADKAIDTYRQYLTTKTDVNSFMNKIGSILTDFEGKFSQEDLQEITSKLKNLPEGTSLQDIVGGFLQKSNN